MIKKLISSLLLSFVAFAAIAQDNFLVTNITTTGAVKKVAYESGESISFTPDAVTTAYAEGITWNFYNSTTGALIRTSTSRIATVSFTHAEGKQGIDVYADATWGTYVTRFEKRHRMVIFPDSSNPDYVINFSLGTSDPRISNDGGGGGFLIDFVGIPCGSMVEFKGTHDTTRDKIINCGSCESNPIIVVIKSVTTINKKNVMTLTGSSGTANIRVGGVLYPMTFSTNLTTTAANFVTANGAAILSATGVSIASSGVTLTATGVSFEMNNTSGNLNAGNGVDEALRIDDGAPTNGLWFYSKKDGSGNRYFNINGGGIGTFRADNQSSHNNIKFTGIRISYAQSAAIKVKLDNVNRYQKHCAEDVWIYDCEIRGPTNEGTYIGWEAASGNRFDPTFNGGDYHHLPLRLKVFANYVHDAGWDGIQATGASLDTEIHDNLLVNNGHSQVSAQDFSMQMGGGFAGQIYNNIFDRHIQVYGSGDTYIYNNYIPGHVDALDQNAVFTKRFNNPTGPSFTGPNGDIYNFSDPAGRFYFFNNIVTSIQDPVYILDSQDDGFAKVPFAEIRILNNTITWSGTAQEALGLRYAESGGSPAITLDSYIAPTVASIMVTNPAAQDISVNSKSPVLFAANEGLDLTATVSPTALKVGLTDMTGQSYPLRGYFKRAPVQRFSGFTPPPALKEQFQWYQTAQTTDASGYSDRVKLTDMYSYKIKTYTWITGSAKPRLVVSFRPVAKTGTINGLELFDDVSN